MGDFVHLHLHSEYSLLDGACRIAEIAKKAKAEGHTAVAITDHGVLYGAVAFYKACKAEGIKPIIGCEVYVAPRTRFDKSFTEDADSAHLVLLCKNEIGYKNLIKMVSASFTEGFYIKPRVDKELLRKHSEGLIALSACLSGRIQSLIAVGMAGDAYKEAEELKDIFGEDFYLEIQDHGIDEQKRVNAVLRTFSDRLGVPLVATNDVHYLTKSDADTQAVMLCIQTNTKLGEEHKIGFPTEEFYYKSTEEMERLFSGYPDAVENTAKIAEKCNFDFTFGKYYLPAFAPPDGSDPRIYLRTLAEKGLAERVKKGDVIFTPSHPETEYRQRMEYELDTIIKMGYAEYYLIVQDFVTWAKRSDIPVGPGRGSGAGSLIAYLLSITDVDPMTYGLFFERFLNPERVSMPDFDIDFCFIRREEVIKYVTRRYGSDRVTQIITFGTMKAKAAVRDAARAMGLPYADGDALVKAMPRSFGATLAGAENDSHFREVAQSTPEMQRLLRTAKQLEGMPRNASTHAAGVVISDKAVSEYVPLAISRETQVTQFDMDTVAELGLLKFDFLGLRTLTVISDAEKMIKRKNPDFSVTALPETDEKTFEMLAKGHTTGVFQLESGGMRQLLTQLEPHSIFDIMIALSMYRPGPMEAIPKMLENRRRGKVDYAIPQLAEILDSTYGCVVYQEQVMQIFRNLASYSLGKSDVVRKAISKKKPEVINKQRQDFLLGCEANGIDGDNAAALFDELVSFAGYAFNKSHAAAYSVVAYRTAYLKAHYPAEFFAALMTSELNNRTKLSEYIIEATKLGIKLLPPSINESSVDFTVEDGNIRYGISALKNVGIGFVSKVLLERRQGGRFRSFTDFCDRMYGKDLNRTQLETLIKAGAFDSMGIYRSRLLAKFDEILERISDKKKRTLTGQISLFEDEAENEDDYVDFPDTPEFPVRALLNLEYEASGMYFSGHLTDEYSENEKDVGATPIASILSVFATTGETEESELADNSSEFKDGSTVTVFGIIRSVTVKNNKKGEKFAFVRIEDRSGEIELLVFSKPYKEYAPLLLKDAVIAANGRISVSEDEPPKIMTGKIAPMRPNDKYTKRPSPFATQEGRGYGSSYRQGYNSQGYSAQTHPESRSVGAALGKQEGTSIAPVNRVSAENAPKSPAQDATPAVSTKVYLRVRSIESDEAKNAIAVIEATKGNIPVFFYDSEKKKYVSRADLKIASSEKALTMLKRLLGEENVVIKD